MPNIPNIKHHGQKEPVVDSDSSLFEIPFYKDGEYFSNLDNFVSFVKGVEKVARNSPYYKRFIAFLKEDKGLNYCQVLGNVEETKGVKIEMHHGPIFTLFDYAAIITEYMLRKNKKVTTFSVAKVLMEEHFNNNIHVVMVCQTVHEEIHANNIFLNLKQGYGNFNRFVKKYREGISPNQVATINNYIEKSLKYESDDKGTLKLLREVRSWSNA